MILQSLDWIKLELFSPDGAEAGVHDKLTGELMQYIERLKFGSDVKKGADISDVQNAPGAKVEPDFDEVLQTLNEEQYVKVKAAFKENIFESGIDPLLLIEDMLNVGELIFKKVDIIIYPNTKENLFPNSPETYQPETISNPTGYSHFITRVSAYRQFQCAVERILAQFSHYTYSRGSVHVQHQHLTHLYRFNIDILFRTNHSLQQVCL